MIYDLLLEVLAKLLLGAFPFSGSITIDTLPYVPHKAIHVQPLWGFPTFFIRLGFPSVHLVTRGFDKQNGHPCVNVAFAHTCHGCWALAVRGNEFALRSRFPHD